MPEHQHIAITIQIDERVFAMDYPAAERHTAESFGNVIAELINDARGMSIMPRTPVPIEVTNLGAKANQ